MSIASTKKSAKKNLILKKAALLFREKGFSATSMRELADAVGMEAASLYNHISSKSAILEEIIFSVSLAVKHQLDEIEKTDKPVLYKIEAVIRFHVQMMLQRFDDYCVMVNEWFHLSAENQNIFATERKLYVKRLEAIIQAGIDAGELKPIMPYVVVLNILSSVRGLEFWHKSSKQYLAEDMEKNIVAHLIAGIMG